MKQDKVEMIVAALSEKASLKQLIYRNTKEVFSNLKVVAETLANELSSRLAGIDKSVEIEYQEVNEFEFRIKFSGDLLMFTMHSNIIAFNPEHILSKSPYIQENYHRGYFGTIMVYNFMADSVKYNRLNDPGYLVARMMLNGEQHFYIEGVRQLNFLYPDIAQNAINSDILRLFVESVMLVSMNNDLVAPAYQDIQLIPLGKKLANQMVFGGEKLGFQMSFQQD